MNIAYLAKLSTWRTPAALSNLFLAGVLMVALTGLSFTAPWESVELKGFDLLTVLSAPKTPTKSITLVSIDSESFSILKQRWPWPRGMHERLIDALKGAGAAVIAFDVIFAFPTDKNEDEALAGAIKRAGNVVLASAVVDSRENKLGTEEIRHNPLPIFTESGAAVGQANVLFDPDRVMRRVPGYEDAFWREVVALLKEKTLVVDYVVPVKPGAMIRYAGPAKTFRRISYYQALDLKPGDLADNVVIVGRDALAAADINSPQVDTFATPFGGERMAGMEIHANILENVLTGQTIDPAPKWAASVLLFVTMMLATLFMRSSRLVASVSSGLVLVSAQAVLAWTLFVYAYIWLPVGISVLGVALLYAIQALFPVAKVIVDSVPSNPAKKATNQIITLKFFISYARREKESYLLFKEGLTDHAKFPGLKIEIFGDDQLRSGSEWDSILKEQVSCCNVMILLVTQAFINSPYIREHELGIAIERKKNGENIFIVPVYVAPCNFQHDEDLKSLQFFKPDASKYERKTKDFCYMDLMVPLDDKVNRNRYMLALMSEMEPELRKLAAAISAPQ